MSQRSRRSVVLFTKPAIPGRVKTRLTPRLTPDQACEVHRALVIDAICELARGRFQLIVAWDLKPGESPDAGLYGAIEAEQVLGHLEQQGSDLGERLFHGLNQALSGTGRANAPAGASQRYVAAVGSDHPEIDHQQVEAAFRILEQGRADVVLGPANDGGYYLIALSDSALDRRIFEDIEWSSPSVALVTLERCSQLGLEVRQLDPADDLDTAEELEALLARVRSGEVRLHPALESLLQTWGMRLP